MADNIKGLTVEFSASTSKFKKQMRDFDKDLKQTRKESNLLAESLKLEWNPEKFKQAQEAARKAIVKTSEKAVVLQARLKHMEEKGLSTDKQRQEFQKLQTELSYTENSLIKLNREMGKLDKLKLENLQKQFDKVGKKLTDVGKAMAPISAMAGAMVGGITAATQSAAKFADEISTLATQLDVTADQMQRYQYIGQQLSVSSEGIAKGFVTLRGTIGKALTGETNKATEALEKLGFTLEDLKIKTADEVFEETIARLSTIEDSTVQATAATQIFGESVATDLLPMLKASSDTMANLNAEYEASGHLTDEQIEKLAKLDNAFKNLKTQLGNIIKTIGSAFAPTFQRLAEFFEKKLIPAIRKITDWFGNFSDGQKDLILGVGALVTALAPLLLIGGKLTSSFGKMLPILKGMSEHMRSLLGPIGIVLGALTLLYATNEEFRKSINKIIEALGKSLTPILKLVADLFSMLWKILQPLIDLIVAILIPALELLMLVLQPILDVVMAIVDAISWIFKQVGKLGSWLGKKLGLSKKEQKAMAEADEPQTGKTATSIAENEAMRSILNSEQHFSNYTDNSQKSFTVNLTINNYGAELDYNDVVKQINRRLAEQY